MARLNEESGERMSAAQENQYNRLKADVLRTNQAIAEAEAALEIERENAGREADSAIAGMSHGFERDPRGGFTDSRDFLQSILKAGMPGGQADERLSRWRAAVGSDEQGIYSDPYGGYLVPSGLAPGVLSVTPEMDPIISRVGLVPMPTKKVEVNARVDKNHSASVSGGLQFRRRAETTQMTADRMEFEQVSLEAHELAALNFTSEELLHSSGPAIAELIRRGFQDALTDKRMRERLRGSGTGEPRGVLSVSADTSGTNGVIQVAKENGQAAATIVKENIDKMAARCWMYSRAVWLANPTTRPQLRSLVQEIGTGGNSVPYFSESGGQEMLDNRPVYFTEHASTLGTAGDLILGVWSEYLYGIHKRLSEAESIHVRFEYNERAFKFWLMDDGQPWWRTALTPANGDTLAPFVTLATRA